MAEVYLLNKEQLFAYKEKVQECFEVDPSHWERRFKDTEEMWDKLFQDEMQMWAVCDADCIHCVFMTEITSKPKSVLKVLWVYGKQFIISFESIHEKLSDFAKSIECEEIWFSGRKGWEKVIAPHGGEFMFSTYKLPVRAKEEYHEFR